MRFYEHLNRSVAKAITFRALIMVVDLAVIIILTRSYDLALVVLSVSAFVHTALYVLHERLWNTVHWGKHHHN